MEKIGARYAENPAVSHPSIREKPELVARVEDRSRLISTSLFAFGIVGCQLLLLISIYSSGVVQGASVAFYALMLLLLWRALPLMPQKGWFGWANSVTLLRASWLCLLMAEGSLQALGLASVMYGNAALWLACLATAFLLLDGLDGWLARTRQAETEYGARFDNEVDGLFVMAVSLLLLSQGAVAGWLVLAGALRYGWLLAGRLFPALARHLPERKKHKSAFVIFSVVLIWGLWPGWAPAVGQAVSLAALVYLLVSFVLDVCWLAQQRS